MGDLLSVRHLHKVYGRQNPTHAVDDVSFTIPEEPTILSLVGESGSGKSTIARIVLGLLRPTSGEVFYEGRNVLARDAAWQHTFRRHVQAVFQDPYSAYNPIYHVERMFRLANRKFRLANGREEAQQAIETSLRAVDLIPEEVLGKYPHQLSGGQRQRLMLARLHLIRPRLIVADEPVSMIDAGMRATFLNILLSFREQLGISTLFITHDLSTAQYLGGSIMVLYQGRVVESGGVEIVTRTPLHPYAQLLVQSIPIPDPTRRWQGTLPPSVDAPLDRIPTRNRCLFAERCPLVLDACWSGQPVLASAGDGQTPRREVACWRAQELRPIRAEAA